MGEKVEVCLSGSGGQGIILAGIILADAAIREGKSAVQSQSYGPEARGGASRAEVIIGGDELDYPKISAPDILLAMSQEACDKYINRVKKDGLVILDSTYVTSLSHSGPGLYSIPISETAMNRLGKEMMANMVALGALIQLTGIVGWEHVRKAIEERVPPGSIEINITALKLGKELLLNVRR